jgi:hypothetical protein
MDAGRSCYNEPIGRCLLDADSLQAATTIYSNSYSDGGITVQVNFKPFWAGVRIATMTIQTDSNVTPTLYLTLMGTGVDAG